MRLHAARVCRQRALTTTMVFLSDLSGLWRRSLLIGPDGRTDTTTEVYWLQGPSLYADLRLPRGRRKLGPSRCLRDLDWPMLRFLARQEGFFGHLDVSGTIAHWHRTFDYQPQTGAADKGRLEFEGDILIEHGVEWPYLEHWRREPQPAQIAVAMRLLDVSSSAEGCLVAAGDAFIYARGRSEPLPANTDLAQLVENSPSLATAQDLFDCEISFGRREGAAWRIERSSLPFREGCLLGPALDAAPATLSVDDLSPEGEPTRRRWRIGAWESLPASAPENWFP